MKNMWHKICTSNSNRKCYVIFLVLIVCFEKPINCLTSSLNGLPANNFVEKCEQRCKEQNRTNSDLIDGEDESLCKTECKVKQCGIGCTLWESALDASCQKVCNKTEINDFDNRQIFCVKGCNDASNFYFQWIKQEVLSPAAPALVPDSLTSTTLSLEWFVPSMFMDLAKGNLFKKTKNETYFVQCYEESEDDWKICGNQTVFENSTIHMERLQPYTKYKFRVALLLSENEAIYSEPSVVISTNEEGFPESPPNLVHVGAVDQTRIVVEWKSGLRNNGPVIGYSLMIQDMTAPGLKPIVKDVNASNEINFYIFEKLSPGRNYSIQIKTRNPRGAGPAAEVTSRTADYSAEDPNSAQEAKIVVVSENTILWQGTDLYQDKLLPFYSTSSKISGVALDVRKKLMFVAEDDGCVYQSSLDIDSTEEKHEVICQNVLNAKPQLLSVDWLNGHLYIMGEIISPQYKTFSISRCDFEGKKPVVAVGGLTGKPVHIEVDPYNGYLFWVIPNDDVDSGLYRLDLGEISNGIKHESHPFQMIKGKNLGAFIVDHTRFRLLVPMQNENTVMSVSLNGKNEEDIRKNTQSPLLHTVLSLAIADNLFIWTNGKEILTEEYHVKHHIYYHNSWIPKDIKSQLIAICVNSSLSQPIPIPVNPPHNCQALLGSTKAKVSWQIPQLVGDQGKGAFKNWNYRLIVIGNNNTKVFNGIQDTSFVVPDLVPDTLYSFKVAAYTSGGIGLWSQEFTAKTLRTSDERFMIWASNDGILQSDVTGENVTTLLPREEFSDTIVDEITWFENILYIVANKTLKIYNRTDGNVRKVGEKETVDGVAIDWIGRRLYWSNHQQQVINRGTLDGKQHEPLSVVAPARQIRIDALRGNFYYSTELTVEGCRMNGKIPKKYFTVPPYSGKQVMGLTLDLENQRIYWIVKSYQGSSLYSAKLLDLWIDDIEPEIVETRLQEKTLSGSLTHFSDRIAWRHDDKSIVFADVNGKNLAYFTNEKVFGLTCFTIIDETHRTYPKINGTINVIPEAIPNSSIQIQGTYKFFNITWDPVINVNYGNVFYEIRIKAINVPDVDDINAEQTENVFQFPTNTLEPYTSLEILIRAFTFWGSSPISKISAHSPTGLPSAPTCPRVYTRYLSYPLEDEVRVSAIFRWSLPDKPNGKILGYKVNCYEFRSNGEKILHDNKTVINMEQVFHGLRKNDRYTFEALAYTSVGEGDISEQFYVDTTHERPVPKVFVSTQEDIVEVDLDQTPPFESHIQTRIPVVAFAHIAYERKLLWFDENNDLISYHSDTKMKTKLISSTSPVKCMTIDWLERIVYWSQMDDNKSTIYSVNLNRAEYLESKKILDSKLPQKVLEQQNVITDLAISPFDRKLFWIENHKNLSEESGIFYMELDTGSIKMLFEDSEECMNKTSASISPTPGSLMFATSPINPRNDENNEHQTSLIFEVNNVIPTQFVAAEIETKKCFVFGSIQDRIIAAENTNLAKDSNKVYWLHEGMVYAREDATNKVISMQVPPKSNRLLAFYQQRYPKKQCLVPLSAIYDVKVNDTTDVSLKLELPQPKLPSTCNLTKISIRYTIQYTDVKNKDESFDDMQCSNDNCHSIDTFERFETIGNLKPFTNYFIQVAMSSVFDKSNETVFIARANFMTERGRPSPPRNISALTLSFSEILVSWLAPETFNSPNLTYEIHWQQENIVDHIRNKQQKMLHHNHTNSDDLISTIIKVLPNQAYSIFVRAYSKNGTYSESESVYVSSYPEPSYVVVNNTTSTSMIIMWNQPENVTWFVIEYSNPESLETLNVTNLIVQDEFGNKYYQIDQLEPKTKYNFSMLLKYVNSDKIYRWLPSRRIEFETKCDVPSPPGKPIVTRVELTEVVEISWNPSKDNGAKIAFYLLESKRVANRAEYEKEVGLRMKRSADYSEIEDGQNDEVITELPPEEDHDKDEKWTEKYIGSDTHCTIKMDKIDLVIFRVKANNSYGFSAYSPISDFNATFYNNNGATFNKEKSNVLLLMISLPITIIFLGIIFVCTILIIYRNRRNKKFPEGIMPIPDFELATLRDIHFDEHLILSNRNILYNQFYGASIHSTEVKHLPHIHLSQIIVTDRCLGKGAFGEVWCGIVKNEDGSEERVAIKTLHKGANDVEKREFLQEAQLMSNFKHDHILRLIGICLNNNESLLYIVMELMEGGDLLSYLRNNRPTASKPSGLKVLDLVSMCVDVASGCRYLEEMHFVHRDIAARNCLVKHILPDDMSGYGRVVKIGDFGLARDIYKNDYYRKEGEGLLPVRWMSPESLIDGVFTSQSDIWAFGVLMWEVITLGQQPYQGQTNIEVLQYVRGGGRLPRPNQNCPEELYQLMAKCWNRVDQRPTFRYCLEVLQQLHDRKNLYAAIEAEFPHDVPYKFVSSDDSSVFNEKIFNDTSREPICNSNGTPSIPKYLELMYDENEGRSVENLCEAPLNLNYSEDQNDENVSYRNSQKLSDLKDGGYEIPISLEPTLDINANNELNNSLSKSRTLSNSSTVSNKSEPFVPLPEAFPESCKQSSLILMDRGHKIYPATKMITRQSGWV